jgi:hypothetical protein
MEASKLFLKHKVKGRGLMLALNLILMWCLEKNDYRKYILQVDQQQN